MQASENARAAARGGAGDSAAGGGPETIGVRRDTAVGGQSAVSREGPREQGRRQRLARGDLAAAPVRDFQSDIKEFAEIACILLRRTIKSLPREVHREITVRDSVLHVLLTTEDRQLLQLSAITVLKEIAWILSSLKH